MWIRSQNKETLIEVKHLAIKGYINDRYAIFTNDHSTPDELCILGMYKTKEKALEVLDEITIYIECQHKPHSYCSGKVFQMPEDKRLYEKGKRSWSDLD